MPPLRGSATIAVALAVVLVSAGCIAAPGGAPGTPTDGTPTDGASNDDPTGTPADDPTATPADGTPTTGGPVAGYETSVFDHSNLGRPAVDGGIDAPPDGPVRRNYATLVATADEADRFDDSVLDPEARTFVGNTSFEESYLVVIQETPAASVPDYRVERVARSDGDLRVWINDSSGYGTDDVTVETLLVRVPRDDASVPDRVVVTTEEGYAFDSSMGIVERNRTAGDR